MSKLYGIPNCDSVKKVRTLLADHSVDYEFVDFKKVAPGKEEIKKWEAYHGELSVNKRGTTFRKIKDDFEAGTPAAKVKLLQENSSALIRPILEKDGEVVGLGLKDIKAKYE